MQAPLLPPPSLPWAASAQREPTHQRTDSDTSQAKQAEQRKLNQATQAKQSNASQEQIISIDGSGGCPMTMMTMMLLFFFPVTANVIVNTLRQSERGCQMQRCTTAFWNELLTA